MAAQHYFLLMLMGSHLPLMADTQAPREAVQSEWEPRQRSFPPIVMEFESCISKVKDERSAAQVAVQVQELIPLMKVLLQGQVWHNQEEALVLAQVLNTAFNLLLTEPPCYGSQELAQAINELLSLFTPAPQAN